MKLSTRVTPINNFKVNAPATPDLVSRAQTQETKAFLKILALGNLQIESGRVRSASSATKQLRDSKVATF